MPLKLPDRAKAGWCARARVVHAIAVREDADATAVLRWSREVIKRLTVERDDERSSRLTNEPDRWEPAQLSPQGRRDVLAASGLTDAPELDLLVPAGHRRRVAVRPFGARRVDAAPDVHRPGQAARPPSCDQQRTHGRPVNAPGQPARRRNRKVPASPERSRATGGTPAREDASPAPVGTRRAPGR